MNLFQDFLYCFIPLFIFRAIDIFGVLPIFVSFTGGMKKSGRRKLVLEASLSAIAVMMIRVGITDAILKH
ncbi:MAG: hypothetical protein M1470_11140 [Bacteroidetes bacterium]|nr:hypothetical protein [Bacteroidota bacterium]